MVEAIKHAFPVTSALIPQAIERMPGALERAYNANLTKTLDAVNQATSNGTLSFGIDPSVHSANVPISQNTLGINLSHAAETQALNVSDDAAKSLNNLHRMGDRLQGIQNNHAGATQANNSLQVARAGGNAAKNAPLWAKALTWLNNPSQHAASLGDDLVRGAAMPIDAAQKASGIKLAMQNASATSRSIAGNVLQKIPRAAFLGGIIEGVFQIGDMKDAIQESGREHNGRIVAQTARSATKVAGAVGVSVASIAAGKAVVGGLTAKGAILGSIVAPGVGTVIGGLIGAAVGVGVSIAGMWAVNKVADAAFGKNQVELAREKGQTPQPSGTTTAPSDNPYANTDTAAMYSQLGFTPEEIAILAA